MQKSLFLLEVFRKNGIDLFINTGKTWVIPERKVYGANMGPTWGRQDPGGPYVGPMNLAISDNIQ